MVDRESLTVSALFFASHRFDNGWSHAHWTNAPMPQGAHGRPRDCHCKRRRKGEAPLGAISHLRGGYCPLYLPADAPTLDAFTSYCLSEVHRGVNTAKVCGEMSVSLNRCSARSSTWTGKEGGFRCGKSSSLRTSQSGKRLVSLPFTWG